MRFTVGYRLTESDAFLKSILRHRERIHEVYFAFGDYANGRGAQSRYEGLLPHEATAKQLSELAVIAKAGIPLNILFNASCYGKDAEARTFFEGIGETVDRFVTDLGLASVTTTSPLIAKFIKQNFPTLRVRASVNMEIGTVQGMRYQSEWFDGFYMKRELNRDLAAIRRLKAWCDQNGKELYMLANSGCLAHCSSHVFHDNLVAHEEELRKMDNAYAYRGTCWEYLSHPEHRPSLVRDVSWVRPEDIELYEGLVTAVKLATRQNAHPERVLLAYMAGKYIGSTLDLLEPNHAGAIAPLYLDNRRFPKDFARRVALCDKNCEACSFCEDVYNHAIIHLEDTIC